MPLTLDDDTVPGSRGRAPVSLNGPGQLDGPTGVQGGFDLQGATTLYWKPVPLLLRQADREDQQEELTFRILTGVSRSNHSMRVLRIHISSESDLFFMHSLEVSEEDFQSLKTEQGILVDFASFPMKIITLLDKCTSTQPVDSPRFQAVLTVRGGESLFRIVETNDFKQLPHITLAFRPGNDSAVKQFLAFRLLEMKSDVDELNTQLAASQAAHSTSSSGWSQVKQQLSTLQEQYDKHMLEVQAEAKTQRAQDLEERAKDRAHTKELHDKEIHELRHRHAELVETLNSRIQQLDAENRKLRDAKYELDTKVSELSARLGSAEGANRSLEEECARLRAMAAQLGGDKAEKEILANDLKARLSAAEEKASAQAEMVEAQRARVRDLEASMRQSEGRCSELKDSLAATEARLRDAQAEVSKGNTIIDKLANDLRVAKEKAKRKQAILVRQEETVKQRDTALVAAERDQQTLHANMDAMKAEVGSLHAENAELRSKLEDSKQQLQSNEQMIRWLNQQVTEAQLGPTAGGMLPSSRYVPYRPALTGPPSSNANTGGSTFSAATPANALLPAPALPSGHAAAVIAATPGSNTISSSMANKYTGSTAAGGAADTGVGLVRNGPSYRLPASPGPASQLRFNTGTGLAQGPSRFEYATPAPAAAGTTVSLTQGTTNIPTRTTQPALTTAAPSNFFGR